MKLFSGGSKTVWVGQGNDQGPRLRAGWIRRGIAVTIDHIVVMVVMVLVGVPAYVLTNGRIQSGGLPSAECLTPAEVPFGMSLPSGIKVKSINECKTTIFGVVVGNTLSIDFDTADGMRLQTGLTWALDREGHVVSGLLLLVLFLPALTVWRAFGDSRGRPTLGRALTRTEVITLRATRPTLQTSLVRQAMNWSLLALFVPPFVWVQLTASFPSMAPSILIISWALGMICLMPWTIGTLGLLQSDLDTIIDRWHGTTVVLRV